MIFKLLTSPQPHLNFLLILILLLIPYHPKRSSCQQEKKIFRFPQTFRFAADKHVCLLCVGQQTAACCKNILNIYLPPFASVGRLPSHLPSTSIKTEWRVPPSPNVDVVLFSLWHHVFFLPCDGRRSAPKSSSHENPAGLENPPRTSVWVS